MKYVIRYQRNNVRTREYFPTLAAARAWASENGIPRSQIKPL